MKRFFVSVRTQDGWPLITRMMVDCETEKQARRAGKRAAVESNLVRFASPAVIAPFVRSLAIQVETTGQGDWWEGGER